MECTEKMSTKFFVRNPEGKRTLHRFRYGLNGVGECNFNYSGWRWGLFVAFVKIAADL
jgi:hypothetical protein